MSRGIVIVMALLMVSACGPNGQGGPDQGVPAVDAFDATNDFYDNEETRPLPVAGLSIDGEVAEPGPVDLAKLPTRSVIVKEALLGDDGAARFVGAYRYDGYSLFDVLNHFKIRKKNEQEFAPVVDLFVEVSNDKGDKVVFSWGEIFYANDLHKILIASSVMRIVPTKSKDLWPLPAASKIVAADDLLTERNILNPSRLTVRSLDASLPGVPASALTIPPGIRPQTYHTVFYGRGRGIHSTTPFTGYFLKDVLLPDYPLTRDRIRRALFTVAAQDGYRVAMTYSEVFNRNDQQEFLLIDNRAAEDGGRFRIFPACDFFSDRSIKAVSKISVETR